MLGDEALEKFLTLDWNRCLDIGSGAGEQARVMRAAGREVLTLDHQTDADFSGTYPVYDFSYIEPPRLEAAWCCHVLEHQQDHGHFLFRLYYDLPSGGWLAITVPPHRCDTVVPGHVTQWSAGLLLYNLVLAGFDCSAAMVKTYGYNISVIVQKGLLTDASTTDTLNDLAHFFPVPLTGNRPEIGELPAHIESVNWD